MADNELSENSKMVNILIAGMFWLVMVTIGVSIGSLLGDLYFV